MILCNAKTFDSTHSPTALYTFAGNINDTSGNGLNLQVAAGTASYAWRLGLQGFYNNGATALDRGVNDDILESLGALTIEVLAVLPRQTGSGTATNVLTFAESAAGSANNILYNAQWNRTGVLQRLGWVQENASQNANVTESTLASASGEALQHYAWVRASDGVSLSFYSNGLLADSGTSANAPTDGSTSQLIVMGSRASGASAIAGTMLFGLKIIVGTALTADQIKAEYNRTLGNVYGYVS